VNMAAHDESDFAIYKERDKAAEKLMLLDGW
jgi:hypothetical protein